MPLLLPPTFAFSQSTLQAYTNCARRFWLAYVQQLPWPAQEASPVQDAERARRLGETFHLLVERAELGMAPETLAAPLEEPLTTWFERYLLHRPSDLPHRSPTPGAGEENIVEIEQVLSLPLTLDDGRSVRLAAKYDLIAIEPGRRAVIIDWKTTEKRPKAESLRFKWQTQVYLYLLVEASAALPWGPLTPDQVEMRYWFTAAPTDPVILRYTEVQHAATGKRLRDTLAAIFAGEHEIDFPKVEDTETNRKRFCGFCVYRSKCNRGTAAGDFHLLEEDEGGFPAEEDALEFTLADIGEMEF